ncbi:MAG: GNAT family N-acetyltransferase [bacterium]
MEDFTVRAERPDDHAAIFAVTEAAFGRADEARLVDALRTGGDAAISLVAETGGRLVGHVLLSRLVTPEGCLALAPVSVTPERQGRRIGPALIREALARAAAEGYSAVFVLGEPGYYTRFGFSLKTAAAFETEYPKEYFMALELRPAALRHRSGRVVYPGAFGSAEG